jgi:hypothetical protein
MSLPKLFCRNLWLERNKSISNQDHLSPMQVASQSHGLLVEVFMSKEVKGNIILFLKFEKIL